MNQSVQSEDFISRISHVGRSKTQKGRALSDSTPPGGKFPKASPNVRKKRIEQAREKNQRGYYNNPEVLSKVAQKLIYLFQT